MYKYREIILCDTDMKELWKHSLKSTFCKTETANNKFMSAYLRLANNHNQLPNIPSTCDTELSTLRTVTHENNWRKLSIK